MKYLIDWLLSHFGRWSSEGEYGAEAPAWRVPVAAEMSIQLRCGTVRSLGEVIAPLQGLCDQLTLHYANAEVKLQTDGVIVHRWGYVNELNITLRRTIAGEIENENKFPQEDAIHQFFEALVDALLRDGHSELHGGAHYVNHGKYRTCVGTSVSVAVKFKSGHRKSFHFFPREANKIPLGAG